MTGRAPLTFKVATEASELEQVARLNYRTFVEEIPQHTANEESALVDKFDRENTYLICLRDDALLGMIAVRGNRPFSLDHKLDDLDHYLPPGRTVCEFRLLSVDPEHRSGRILLGLMNLLDQHCADHGYDLAVISGTTRQLKLYEHLGFVPFGPLVGEGEARFQPMYLTLESATERAKPLLRAVPSAAAGEPLNLMPGPVTILPEARAAFAAAPVSHRAESFVAEVARAKRRLRELTNARQVEILTGSGTLANDTVAAQLSLLGGQGLVLSNGEFGERLVDHAGRWGLACDVLRAPWGEPFDAEAVEAALAAPGRTWAWVPHCETSTGVLQDLGWLAARGAEYGVRLCVDAISSIGTVPVDLSGAFLASGASGKGLAAYPGLALVFADHRPAPAPGRLPRALDLGLYAASEGVPFTLSSNLLGALGAAAERVTAAPQRRFTAIAELADWLRAGVRAAGWRTVADDAVASPAVTTLVPPTGVSALAAGDRLAAAGFLVSYRSGYLLERGWIQLCLMGDEESYPRAELERLTGLLAGLRRPARAS